MKVFIAVDMEGATGIVHADQLMPDGRNYAQGQRMLTADVNAVIRGVLRVHPDATFVVGDGHGTMRNILLEELHPSAELVVGSAKPANKPLCQLEGIQFGADAAMCIGYHSKAGTAGGLLAHTYIGSLIRELRLNGRPVGEVESNTAVMSSFGVPLAMVSGNSDLVSEVHAWCPTITAVSTKTTLGPTAAICKTPAVTKELLENAAEHAMRSPQTWFLRNEGATHYVVDTYRREQCERACTSEGVVAVSDTTFAVEADNAAEAFRLMWRACTRALDEPAAWLS